MGSGKILNKHLLRDGGRLEYPTPKNSTQQSLSKRSPSTQSFEDTYKTAYSHGLESIYALENVDLKTVRRLVDPSSAVIPAKAIASYQKRSVDIVEQLEFDFGDAYRGWMESFSLQEPIQVLELSKHAEKCLIEHGKLVLRDLIGADLREFVFYKGMGQGHIDEIQQKLRLYLEEKELFKARTIDFVSWVRSLVAAFDRKKVFVCLEAYGLGDLFSLSPAESVEVRRLTLEKKQEWIQEILQDFQSEKRRQAISVAMSKVVAVFVRPWMCRRHGIATRHEIVERLEKISETCAMSKSVLSFFSDIYFDKIFPLSYDLYHVDSDLYCANAWTAASYRLVIERASTYFYNTTVSYSLDHLLILLEKEFAMMWMSFPQDFVKKVLQHSSRFRIRKSTDSKLLIRFALRSIVDH